MRLYEIDAADVEHAMEQASRIENDEKGNPRLRGRARDGRAIIVVIANDDAAFVITTFPDA